MEPPDCHRFEHHAVRLNRVAMAVLLDEEDRLAWSSTTAALPRRTGVGRKDNPVTLADEARQIPSAVFAGRQEAGCGTTRGPGCAWRMRRLKRGLPLSDSA